MGLGDALLAAGRDLEASQAFERALAVQPDLPEAHYGYARAMIAIRRPEVAVDHLRRLTESRPGTRRRSMRWVWRTTSWASTRWRRDLPQGPGHAAGLGPLRNNLALSLALQEQFPDALDELRPIAEGPGSTRRTRQNLALVYGLQGDFAAAERLSRVDLAGGELQDNLSYFATVRGMEDPAVRRRRWRPTGELAWDERRTARARAVPSVANVRHVPRVPAPSTPWHQPLSCRRRPSPNLPPAGRGP